MNLPGRGGDTATAAACGGISLLTGLAAILATQGGWPDPSALVKIATSDRIAGLARAADPHFHLVTPAQHYDGTYYYAMARDPFLHGSAHALIDQPAYRYGHPLHGWLAGLLSGGHSAAVPAALLALSLVGLALAGWAVSRVAVALGRTPWAGLLVAASPGLLYSATVDTTEALGAALVALALLAWLRGRFGAATLLVVLCCLDKEQYVVVPAGLLAWEIVAAMRRHRLPERVVARGVAVALGPLTLAGWYLYVHQQLHQWPWSYQPGNFGAPVTGWLEAFRLGRGLAVGDFDQAQIGNVDPVVLVAMALILVAAAVAALRARTVLDLPYLGMAVITSMQGWRTLLYPHELFRTTAVALLLGVGVLLSRHRQPARAAAAE